MVKTAKEINKIRQAAKITDQAYQNLLKTIKAGRSEKDLAEIIESLLKKQGAEKLSFDTIVVSGVNGALPHGQPSNKIIKEGELITMDFGCKYQGFCSDFTRIEAVKPGIKCNAIDQIVRDYIQTKGYGEYFVHSTGHGLGIEVHEEPRISPKDETILQPGMIITVEPGIYIPGLGGVRIEDDVLVTEKNLPTTASSNFLVDFRPGEHATVVNLLTAAGAILTGKTAMDEFA
ncbi:7016_t:CDS:2, partial [Funneliformis geosporum]